MAQPSWSQEFSWREAPREGSWAWSRILVRCHSRIMSKSHQEGRPKLEGQQGVGRTFWVPAKMVEEGVAFPSLPTLLLPGKQGTWKLWLFP